MWWQFLVISLTAMSFSLVAVFIGGYLVFKAKTITMPTPFFHQFKQNRGETHSYVDDLYGSESEEDVYLDDSLSPAASRLRDQKMTVGDSMEENLKVVMGKK